MSKTNWYTLWIVLYAACTGLGFVLEPQGIGTGFLVLLSLLFFLPPAMLLRWAIPREKWNTVRLIRRLSLASLTATFLLLLCSFLSIVAPQWAGDVLHVLLGLVSTPMFCAQSWVVSLFLWACLLMVTLKYRKR